MPGKQITVCLRGEPWITEAIKRTINNKNKIHKTAKNRNADQSWRRSRQARNEFADIIRHIKLEYFRELDHRISNKENWLFSRDVIKSCQSAIFLPLETDAKRAVQ